MRFFITRKKKDAMVTFFSGDMSDSVDEPGALIDMACLIWIVRSIWLLFLFYLHLHMSARKDLGSNYNILTKKGLDVLPHLYFRLLGSVCNAAKHLPPLAVTSRSNTQGLTSPNMFCKRTVANRTCVLKAPALAVHQLRALQTKFGLAAPNVLPKGSSDCFRWTNQARFP